MSWQRARRQDQKDERIAAILEAAAELYETRDFDDVHMGAIADRVGLAKASLYEYFSTKDDVFESGYRFNYLSRVGIIDLNSCRCGNGKTVR